MHCYRRRRHRRRHRRHRFVVFKKKEKKKKNDVTKNEKWPFAFKLFFKNSYYRFKAIYFSDGNDGQLFWSLGSFPRPSNKPRGMCMFVWGVTSSLPTTTTYIITWFPPPLPAQPNVTAIMFEVFKSKSQNNMTCFSHAREEILCVFFFLFGTCHHYAAYDLLAERKEGQQFVKI